MVYPVYFSEDIINATRNAINAGDKVARWGGNYIGEIRRVGSRLRLCVFRGDIPQGVVEFYFPAYMLEENWIDTCTKDSFKFIYN